MIEVLPIRLLTDEDALVFGTLSVSLGKLLRAGLPVGMGIVVTPPNLKLKTTLEGFDFGTKEVFEQSLTLVKKEINSTPIPQVLTQETGKHKQFLLNGMVIKGKKNLWLTLLNIWLEEIKGRLWNNGFYQGITDNLDPQVVTFIKKLKGVGIAYFDGLQDEVVVNAKTGKLHANDLAKIEELVQAANKKLFLPFEYEWILDRGVKLTKVLPYTPNPVIADKVNESVLLRSDLVITRSAVKVFFDLSEGFTIVSQVDGIYIASEKIFDLNKPNDSFEQLVFKLVESAVTFPDSPIFFKLADMSEGMGKIRGALRLLHQKSLFEPLLEALDFARHKKGLQNIHIVVPFVRGVNELLQIKRELATKKLSRKNSLKLWMEVAVPENIINLEDYLLVGIDGVVLNLDELIAHLNGFDPSEDNLAFYKQEVEGLLKFLEDGIRLLHIAKIPFLAYGSLTLYPKVLEYLVEKGVYGVVVERYETHSAHDLLHQVEKRMILRKIT